MAQVVTEVSRDKKTVISIARELIRINQPGKAHTEEGIIAEQPSLL
jgi:hypothetical protein